MSNFEYAGETDVGRKRRENQDRWYADAEEGLFLVADGISSTGAGKLAAEIVVEVLPRLLRQRLRGCQGLDEDEAVPRVVDALAEMSDRLNAEGRQRFGRNGIGSTVVLALIRGRRALVVHLGDSRAYLLHRTRLKLLTQDHNLAQMLVASGTIQADEARKHPGRVQLTRFVGMGGKSQPDAQLVPLARSDRLLLCTDGLYGMLEQEQLQSILAEKIPSAEVCRRLVAAANEAGGKDNITALVVTVAK